PLSLEILKRFEETASPYDVKWVQTNYRLYRWLNDMCADPRNFCTVPLEELRDMGFQPQSAGA
ncbi:MAG: hypothetical protein QXH52_05490, partial [Candidatus Caldarchaeum sp.]